MDDKYPCFAELAAKERENSDYRISIEPRNSAIAIVAPHGGHIEPGTTEIAHRIAGNEFNFYSFMGIKKGGGNRDLHITSHRFDEPGCLELISHCDFVLAIHGRADHLDAVTVSIGGRDIALRRQIEASLREAGFAAQPDDGSYPASHPMNICNRGRRGMGAQLELPRSLRDRLASDIAQGTRFAAAVRSAMIA